MALTPWINHDKTVALSALPKDCINELQTKLCDLGLLDPVIHGTKEQPFGPIAKFDGIPGSETRAALKEYCRLIKSENLYIDGGINKAIMGLLDRSLSNTFLPLDLTPAAADKPQNAIAKKVLAYMRRKGYWIALSPGAFNIVYVEGMNADGSLNDDALNHWNDRRMVISIQGGCPVMLVNDQATTEPGKFYTRNPEAFGHAGVARLGFGQYKAWRMGMHNGSQPALIQAGLLRIFRDTNKDGLRRYGNQSDPVVVSRGNGINQHSTRPNAVPELIDSYSAGCLVGRRYRWHLSFMEIISDDYRYVYDRDYKFITTLIPGNEL